MDARGIQNALRVQGWPIGVDGNIGPTTRQAVRDFQGAWVASPGRRPLTLDGQPGPDTQWALQWVLDHDLKIAGYFRAAEFKSKGNGWIKVSRDLLWWLDRYRERFGPTSILSGYRDPAHNRRVGGASRSQHLYGTAADIRAVVSVSQVRALGGFTGIGYNASTGRVAHVDRRPGNPSRPVVWRYSR